MAPANSNCNSNLNADAFGSGRIVKCSYKRVTMVICTGNLVFALYVLYALLSPLYVFSPSSSATQVDFRDEEFRRMSDAVRIRQAEEPVDLIQRVKEIQEEAARDDEKRRLMQSIKQKLCNELLDSLKVLKTDSKIDEEQAVEKWRKRKLIHARKHSIQNASTNSTVGSDYSEFITRILENDWVALLEDAGLSMPSEASSIDADNSGKLVQKGLEIEDGIIPGRPLPAECNAKAHTDYDGVAVRWGLTFHKESAADCCQACLDQAKNAKDGEKKCNIWVYCPSETGCYSPDIYEHKHKECWLKQADHPKLNFKGKYSHAYRRQHPTAPVVVPWVAGAIDMSEYAKPGIFGHRDRIQDPYAFMRRDLS